MICFYLLSIFSDASVVRDIATNMLAVKVTDRSQTKIIPMFRTYILHYTNNDFNDDMNE